MPTSAIRSLRARVSLAAALALAVPLGGCDAARDWWQGDAIAEVRVRQAELAEKDMEIEELTARLAHLDRLVAEQAALRKQVGKPAPRKPGGPEDDAALARKFRVLLRSVVVDRNQALADVQTMALGLRPAYHVTATPRPLPSL